MAISLIFSVSLIASTTSNLKGFPGRWKMRKMCLTCMPKGFLWILVEEKLQLVFRPPFWNHLKKTFWYVYRFVPLSPNSVRSVLFLGHRSFTHARRFLGVLLFFKIFFLFIYERCCKVPLFWGKLVQSTAHSSRPGGLVGIHTQS